MHDGSPGFVAPNSHRLGLHYNNHTAFSEMTQSLSPAAVLHEIWRACASANCPWQCEWARRTAAGQLNPGRRVVSPF